jgi:uncharacterized protein
VLDRGYFAGFSIYPHTKMGNERLTEIVRQYGPECIIVDIAPLLQQNTEVYRAW